MKIRTEIHEDGIVCEADLGTRHYRSKYRGDYTLKEAKKRFVARVLKAEQEETDRIKLEALLMCLNCQLPANKCKGACRYRLKGRRQIPRGKRVTT